MFKTILLPVDLSNKHQQALNAAADLAGFGKGEVILLHVIETISGVSMDEERNFYQRLEKMARKHLEQLAGHFIQRTVPCRSEVVFGNRGSEIVRYATDQGIDLIVLTAPRLDPQNPGAGWASLSWKISMLSPCPVLLVK